MIQIAVLGYGTVGSGVFEIIRENKEKRWGERVENENGKIGEMEKKGMEKCGWTAGEMFSII